MRSLDQFKTLAQQETSAERLQRMVPGAVYGVIIAGSYALVGSIVNQLSFPDLPVGVDWRNLLTTSLFFAIWLGLGGMFINWFTQTEEGMVASLLLMMGTALAAAALTFKDPLPVQLGKIILLALPVIAISLLMTITLRWLGVKHVDALERDAESRRRRILALFVIAMLIGAGTGSALTRWTTATQRGIRHIHENIQAVVANPSGNETLFIIRDVPELKQHLDIPYTLRGKPSGQSVVAIEVNVDFEDGYHVVCILLVFPDQPPFPRACAEGEHVSLPPP